MKAPVSPKGKFSTPFTSGRLGGMSGGVSAGKTSGAGPTAGSRLMEGASRVTKNLPKGPGPGGKVSSKV